jgi:predicted cupin superfamily sugar epimerase
MFINKVPNDFIRQFDMLPHPEGGWYKENYRSKETIASSCLPEEFNGTRNFSTAIYFLLENGNFSSFHRIKSDEVWHFYAGGPLEIFILHNNGQLEVMTLGSDLSAGELFQQVVPANVWFASKPKQGVVFSLVGCTVSPGFDFEDFEMAQRDELIHQFPQHQDIIKRLTRQ